MPRAANTTRICFTKSEIRALAEMLNMLEAYNLEYDEMRPDFARVMWKLERADMRLYVPESP